MFQMLEFLKLLFQVMFSTKTVMSSQPFVSNLGMVGMRCDYDQSSTILDYVHVASFGLVMSGLFLWRFVFDLGMIGTETHR